MRPFITMFLALAVSVLAASPAPADAAVDVHVNIGLPVAPPLVVVQPGVSVVEDWDEEVFYVAPYYWVRRGDLWYRARSPRAAFRVAPVRVVPVALVRMPPGQYVKYKKARHERYDDRGGHGRGHDHDRGHGHGGHGHGNRHGGHGNGHGNKRH